MKKHIAILAIVALVALCLPVVSLADKIGILWNGSYLLDPYSTITALIGAGNSTQIQRMIDADIPDANDTEINRLATAIKALSTAPMNGTVGATTPAAGVFTTITADSYSTNRTDAAQQVKLYEATSDGDSQATITVPAKGTGLGGNATITYSQTLAFTGTMTDGKYCTYASSGAVIACNSTPAGDGDFKADGSVVMTGNIVFEGSVADDNETTFSITNPTADRTITVPDASGTMLLSGLATGGVILGDSTPDAEGELGYASNQLSIHDGTASRSLLQVASTTITKYQYFPIRYAEDNATGTAPAAAAEVGTTSIIARSFAEDADNVVALFWQVDPEWTAGLKYRVYYALNANASADNTVVFQLAGCSVGNSDALACTEGTAIEVADELGTDDDQYQLMVTDWSGAVTVTNLAAGEMAKLDFWRDVAGGAAEDDYGDHALVVGIEIKYQAKVSAASDY